ncbi:MAG: hypothetical protein K2O42_03330 [Oscillospiraceae bacterium]|nr:hypothetical protein [Oscillospiraceae bacterium]
MKFRKLLCVLMCCVTTAALAGCNKKQDSETDSSVENPDSAVNTIAEDDGQVEEVTTPVLSEKAKEKMPENQPKADGTSDIHVTIESIEVTLDELKAQDYVVPVMILLEENSGITYSEWGASVDERCKFTADNEGTSYSVYYSINDEKHFMWTAWSSGSQIEDTPGKLLQLQVVIPEDAAVGDHYEVKYQSVSMADKPHVWSNDTDSWVDDGYVTWTDGGITVVDQKTATEPEPENAEENPEQDSDDDAEE